MKGKLDYAILALLVGCALRRRELASLAVEDIQMRENRWAIADLRGKGGRVRTVAVPLWVKHGINEWQAASKVEAGPLLRSISKGGKVGESLSDGAIWAVVTEAAKEIGIENFGAHDVRRTCAKLCRRPVATWSRSSSCWATLQFRQQSATWLRAGNAVAVDDSNGFSKYALTSVQQWVLLEFSCDGIASTMADELETLSEEILRHAAQLREFGQHVQSQGDEEPSTEQRCVLYKKARSLVKSLESLQREINGVSLRSERAMVATIDVNGVRDVSVDLAGALGGLYASLDFLKDEELHATDRTSHGIGSSFIRDARELPDIAVRLRRVRGMKSPKRFAVGTSVRVRMPGVDGVVTQMDSERTTLSEYWHTVTTEQGERREPGSNLEKIDPPLAHTPHGAPMVANSIHFHGHNSRVTVGGNDHSANTVGTTSDELFAELRRLAGSISSNSDRQVILARIGELEAAQNTTGFIPAYQAFMGSLSDHITVFTALLPALTLLLSSACS